MNPGIPTECKLSEHMTQFQQFFENKKNVIFVHLSTKKGIVWKNTIFREMTKIWHTYGLPGIYLSIYLSIYLVPRAVHPFQMVLDIWHGIS